LKLVTEKRHVSVSEIKSPFIKQLEPAVTRKLGEKTRFLKLF
jgi:hypothetical protein